MVSIYVYLILNFETFQRMPPHPPSKNGPRSSMGNYRTTLFRRDFNRLQAQRNQGLPKEPVSVKQGASLGEKGAGRVRKLSDAIELEVTTVSKESGQLHGDAALSSGLQGVANVSQISTFSEDERQVEQVQAVHCTYIQCS